MPVALIMAANGAAGAPYWDDPFRSQLAGGFRRLVVTEGLNPCPPLPVALKAGTRPGQSLSSKRLLEYNITQNGGIGKNGANAFGPREAIDLLRE